MSRFQLTLWQLDDYGPWTTTPEPRPEMALQELQSRLYADLAAAVGERDAYVFQAREDNVVGVTNGLDRAAHRAIADRVATEYPVSLSAGVGTGATPVAALEAATTALQSAGSAQDPDRESVLRGEILDAAPAFHVAHFDVVDATGSLTDAVDAAAAYEALDDVTRVLRSHLRERHDGLAFFVGGDNVVGVVPPLSDSAYRDACEAVREQTGTSLRVGVGEGTSARVAGMAAKHALEDARETDQSVVAPEAVAAD